MSEPLIPDEVYTGDARPSVRHEHFKVIAHAQLTGNWHAMTVGGMSVGQFFANAIREDQERQHMEEKPQSLFGSPTEIDTVAWRSSDGKEIEPPSSIMCPTCEARDSAACETCNGRGVITVAEAQAYRRQS